ncbi:MAG TPA: SUF system NifU family Fe-S cluster assembly protein [Gammaproteobacteria bacterium]|jgi:nitrogen fixation NifU-like protein|nr:SUF system NifU family Fe-S cluster assembly protein [Gammaproteobacteria bacterium]
MSELRELYQEVILDHGKSPRNFKVNSNATYSKEGFNPLCGDKITLYLEEEKGCIKDLSFHGCGCAISMASGSLMTECLIGKPITFAVEIFDIFHQSLTQGELTDEQKEKLGKLNILSGVIAFPLRVKCATLAWHTLKALLNRDNSVISTEAS